MAYNDKFLYKDFVDEATELIQNSEAGILSIEGNIKPESAKIDVLFRAIHTIKGSAGLLGLSKINLVAHNLENILSLARKDILVFNPECIDILLEAIDNMKNMIDNCYNLNDIDVQSINLKLINFYNQRSNNASRKDESVLLKNKKESIFTVNKHEFIPLFITNSRLYFKQLELLFTTDDVSVLPLNYKQAESLLNSLLIAASMLDFQKITDFLKAFLHTVHHTVENEKISPETNLTLCNALYKIQMLIEDCNQLEIYEIYKDIKNLNTFVANKKNEASTAETVNRETVVEKKQSIELPLAEAQQHSETIRLDIRLVDKLMNLASELVLIRNQGQQLIPRTNPAIEQLLQRLNITTTEIQETVMESRMQPISHIFSKYNRIVRDLAKQLNKEIELQIFGENVEIDKAYIEELSAPITHLIRNSLDHGIENNEERIAKGKKPHGTIELKASQDANIITISISDDGKGINPDKIAETAVNLGFVSQSDIQAMSKKQIIDLIWIPGFTTMGVVTDLSGRGVGMDVVQNVINKLGGTIEVSTRIDEGTEFIIKLPFTLSIIDSLIIKSKGELFAIPQANVSEIVKLDELLVKEKLIINQEGMFLSLRETIVAIESLNTILENPKPLKETKANTTNTSSATLDFPLSIMIVKNRNRKYGLIIDEYIGSEEIVVKPLHQLLKTSKIYSGSTVLGNGCLALILDIPNVILHAGLQTTESSAKTNTETHTIQEKDLLLSFCYNSQEQFALPLTAIKRLHTFPATDLQQIGKERMVAIDQQIYRIFGIDELLELKEINRTGELCLIILKETSGKTGILASAINGVEKEETAEFNERKIHPLISYSALINKKVSMVLDAKRIQEKINEFEKETR